MKQAQSVTTPQRPDGRGGWWPLGPTAPRPMGLGRRRASTGPGSARVPTGPIAAVAGPAQVVRTVLGAAWSLATLPFRLVFWALAWLGRITALAIGFALMVAGIFFLAGPFLLVGLPMFLIGLVLTLRCLD